MNDLLDLVGVIIAFSTVMLLLSLVVTGLVQFLQNSLFLRSLALRTVLEWVIGQSVKKPGEPGQQEQIQDLARGLVTHRLDHEKAGFWKGVLDLLWGLPHLAKMDLPEFQRRLRLREAAIQKAQPDPAGGQTTPLRCADIDMQLLEDAFASVKEMAKAIFVRYARICSFVIGLMVAFSFQVSTPNLLRELSTNPQLRASYEAIAEEVVMEAADSLEAIDYRQVAANAYVQLTNKHPDFAEILLEASLSDDNKADLVEEMEIILERHGEPGQAVLNDYRKLLEAGHAKAAMDGLENAAAATGQLARLNIEYWKDGWAFYQNPAHWFGVFLTAILLSFGAPFWYDLLKSALEIKRRLQGKKPLGSDGAENSAPAETAPATPPAVASPPKKKAGKKKK